MPSHDIIMRIERYEAARIHRFAANCFRRESYFRAILVQSRGVRVRRCLQRCGNDRTTPRFRECVRLNDYRDVACVMMLATPCVG